MKKARTNLTRGKYDIGHAAEQLMLSKALEVVNHIEKQSLSGTNNSGPCPPYVYLKSRVVWTSLAAVNQVAGKRIFLEVKRASNGGPSKKPTHDEYKNEYKNKSN